MPRHSVDRAVTAERLNFAVGLFDEVERVEAVVGELQVRSVPCSRCRFVVGFESPFLSQQERLRLAFGLAMERVALDVLDPEHAWTEIVIGRQLPGSEDTFFDYGHDDTSTSPALVRQNMRLVQHLEAGGGALVVGLEDQAQQQAIAGVMLRLASQVFTHQMRALRHETEAQTARSCAASEPPADPARLL